MLCKSFVKEATSMAGLVMSIIRSGMEFILEPFQIPRRVAVAGYPYWSNVPKIPTAEVSEVAFCQIKDPVEIHGQLVGVTRAMDGASWDEVDTIAVVSALQAFVPEVLREIVEDPPRTVEYDLLVVEDLMAELRDEWEDWVVTDFSCEVE